jgi:hypothetical protein
MVDNLLGVDTDGLYFIYILNLCQETAMDAKKREDSSAANNEVKKLMS